MRTAIRVAALPLGLVLGTLACEPSAAPTTAPVEPEAAAPSVPSPRPGAPFAWRLRTQSPTAEVREFFPEVAHGRVPQQVSPWVCDYSLEDTNVDGELAEQFGVLACASQRSGMRAAALVMCMTSPQRPSECGSGNVQVTGADGNEHRLSLSCATAQSDCFTRPEASPRRGVGSARAAGAEVATGGDASVSDDGVDGALWASWTVGTYREGFGDRRVSLDDRSGALPSVTDAWRCSYSVEPGSTADGVKAEIGTIRCVAQTGETVGTSAVCIEASDGGGFANAAALRLSGPETPDIALMLDCKSGPRG